MSGVKGRRLLVAALRLGSYKPTTFRWWVVDLRFESDADLLHLMWLKNTVDARVDKVPSMLFCPYFPYSRMDRAEGTRLFTLKSIARLINSLEFSSVWALEPHSDVLPALGAIYGDSITYDRAKAIYERLEAKGFAVSNVTLGIGSYTYQYVTRDTFGFSLKATHAVVDGEERVIYKDPVTDKIAGNNFKKSQRGLCYVYRDGDDIRYKDCLTLEEYNSEEYADNLLHTVFEDGVVVHTPTLTEIRERLHEKSGGFSWLNRKAG